MNPKKTKRDIDKEMMYSKIMPSSAANHAEESEARSSHPLPPAVDSPEYDSRQEEGEVALQQEHEAKALETHPAAEDSVPDADMPPAEAVPAPLEKSAEPEASAPSEITDDGAEKELCEDTPSPAEDSAEKTAPCRSAPAAEEAANETMLVNIKERMVMDKLEKSLEKFNCCKCRFCRQDVAAGALNLLAPKYAVVMPADIEALIRNEDERDVTAALIKAILHVRNNPRH